MMKMMMMMMIVNNTPRTSSEPRRNINVPVGWALNANS